MALMPGAVIKLIPRHNVGKRRPLGRGTSFHVTASAARSMFGYFGTVEDCSHFHVAKDGTIEQYIDTAYYGRAQVDGNDMVTVETQGAAPGVNAETEPWTDAQVASNARIARWVHDTEGAPLVLMPDSRPTSRGVGCHRLGIAPWRVKGGQVWSHKNGKVCPGSAKVRQLPQVIKLAQGVAPGATPAPAQEDDMADPATISAIAAQTRDEILYTRDTSAAGANRNLGDKLNQLIITQAQQGATINALAGLLASQAPMTAQQITQTITAAIADATVKVTVAVQGVDGRPTG